MENLQKCLYTTCPIQEDSACVKEKGMKMQDMMPKMMESKMMPDPEMVPGMYCATGKSSCGDIDTNKRCICNECALWEEYDLPNQKPKGFYCRDGALP
ncbi:MAG: DUF2769 domain-containing protein [Euryarchaeota archaeon]|nr:DUF2769 domain-containing protein [Euryarchaeota archaeon]MBU4547498.1 DUF2769 domain-containing protein [Euryarchaeota archaeon]MBU4608699.1 DUF2769 domain-containing protein [Euryarchaeota archaeon]MBV1754937.1 DUF2769 domain-containing protein [Methanobacterium sp.]